jgi:precorrin isomerase
LQVLQDGDSATRTLGRLAHRGAAPSVLLATPVGEVQAGDAEPGFHEIKLEAVGRRTERGN